MNTTTSTTPTMLATAPAWIESAPRSGPTVRSSIRPKTFPSSHVGVPTNRTALLGYVGASLLTLLGAVVLLAQLGVGDPGQGTGYTLTSITAVVLGGTSLLGGRGTFIGTLMGAGLSVQVLNATVFLNLDQKWQYLFQGLLIVAAAIIYSQVRRGAMRVPGRA